MLVGSNGSGKSTLFRMIGGLVKPQTGTIHCTLRPALVFQNPDHQLLLPSCGNLVMCRLTGRAFWQVSMQMAVSSWKPSSMNSCVREALRS